MQSRDAPIFQLINCVLYLIAAVLKRLSGSQAWGESSLLCQQLHEHTVPWRTCKNHLEPVISSKASEKLEESAHVCRKAPVKALGTRAFFLLFHNMLQESHPKWVNNGKTREPMTILNIKIRSLWLFS